jgi:hypothetical protein
LVAIRRCDAALRRTRRTHSSHRVEELLAVQAQCALGQALLDLVFDLELRDHHGELALTVVRLGRDVPLEVKQHSLVIHEHVDPDQNCSAVTGEPAGVTSTG